MSGEHHYRVTTTWIGDRGTGTSGYRDYDRTVRIGVDGKPDVIGSADPARRRSAPTWAVTQASRNSQVKRPPDSSSATSTLTPGEGEPHTSLLNDSDQ